MWLSVLYEDSEVDFAVSQVQHYGHYNPGIAGIDQLSTVSVLPVIFVTFLWHKDEVMKWVVWKTDPDLQVVFLSIFFHLIPFSSD